VIDVSKFWDLVKDGTILVGTAIVVIFVVSLVAVGLWAYMLIVGQEVPPELSQWLQTLLGVWLGVLGSAGATGWARARSRALAAEGK
jgi:hypothetical protein